MTTAGLGSIQLAIEFTTGTFTDVSTYLRLDEPAEGSAGRPSPFDETAASTMQVTLRNEDGRFTPDNPLSPYWPDIVENKRIRLRAVRSGTTYRIFQGYVTRWSPSFPKGDSTSGAVVVVDCADVLALLDRHELGSLFLEECLGTLDPGVDGMDIYPMDDPTNAKKLRNAGALDASEATGSTLGAATIVSSTQRRGSWQVQQGSDTPWAVPGYLSLRPSGTAGPILKVAPAAVPQVFAKCNMWVRFPAAAIPAPGIPLTVLQAYASSGLALSLRLVNNAGSVDLQLFDSGDVLVGTVATAVNDDAWHYLLVRGEFPGGGSSYASAFWEDPSTAVLDTVVIAATDIGPDFRRVYIGGSCTPLTEGKNAACVAMDLAGLTFPTSIDASQQFVITYGDGSTPVTAAQRFGDLTAYATSYLSSASTVGTDARNVLATDTTGRSLLDCLQELTRSIGAVLYQLPTGTLNLYLADAVHSTTAVATIDVENDADGAPELTRSVDTIPTRVTVTTPGGSATAVNTDAESGATVPAARREVQISSCVVSDVDATSLGWSVLRAAASLRLSELSVDLVTSVNSLWALLVTGTMRPGARLRVSNLPTATFGVSYMDVEVQGWKWAITHDHYGITVDTTPADVPVRGKVGTGEYSKAGAGGQAAVTGGTAVGTTAVGTIDVDTGAAAFTTAVGAYPMDLSWNGERVTVTSAPASAVTPQTFTITARGVAPTVARSHDVFEFIDVWHAATAAL